MSDEPAATPTSPPNENIGLLDRISPAALISAAAGATLVALLAIVSLILLISLSDDVARLEDQVRKLNKHAKTMEQDLADMRSTLDASTAAAAATPSQKPAAPRATHIDTADPVSDCVIRSGSKGGLTDCLK